MSIDIPIPSSSGRAEDAGTFQLKREEDGDNLLSLHHVAVEPLLAHLDSQLILRVFGSLLMERRIIFYAENLSDLSSCVQTFMALLYPFAWQHIYIPVLPRALLTFCCAPMPFVVGVLRNCVAEIQDLPLSEVLIVDLDEGRIVLGIEEDDYRVLPPLALAPLEKSLVSICKTFKRRKKKKDSRIQRENAEEEPHYKLQLSDNFLFFFVDILSSYREFISSEGFEKENFIKSRDVASQKFFEAFVGSQMFEMFIRDRIKRKEKNNSPVSSTDNKNSFESLISNYDNVQHLLHSKFQDTLDTNQRSWSAIERKVIAKQEEERSKKTEDTRHLAGRIKDKLLKPNLAREEDRSSLAPRLTSANSISSSTMLATAGGGESLSSASNPFLPQAQAQSFSATSTYPSASPSVSASASTPTNYSTGSGTVTPNSKLAPTPTYSVSKNSIVNAYATLRPSRTRPSQDSLPFAAGTGTGTGTSVTPLMPPLPPPRDRGAGAGAGAGAHLTSLFLSPQPPLTSSTSSSSSTSVSPRSRTPLPPTPSLNVGLPTGPPLAPAPLPPLQFTPAIKPSSPRPPANTTSNSTNAPTSGGKTDSERPGQSQGHNHTSGVYANPLLSPTSSSRHPTHFLGSARSTPSSLPSSINPPCLPPRSLE